MKKQNYILFPFSILYNAVTGVRNYLYDKGLFDSESFTVPVICVGNLRVGGTGKTPFVDYLIQLFLKEKFRLAVLSRGYGRKSRGFLQVSEDSETMEVGDEPLQYILKHRNKLNVYVNENRPEGVTKILDLAPETDIIILDDAFQHRAIKARVNILLTEYGRPFYEDVLLPAGRLRESRSNAGRADFIVVTKCPPGLNESQMHEIRTKILKYTGGVAAVYFTSIMYQAPVCAFSEDVFLPVSYHIVSGIDNPEPFVSYCEAAFEIKKKTIFSDHYNFTESDIQKLKSLNIPILTTQKDIARLKKWEAVLRGTPVFYIPIEVEFVASENDFTGRLKKLLKFGEL